ncbi:transposase [Streptomyces sp. NPDC059534]|uniref:transposase n=1 Tax=Streptomyces sp. NPDC059534 TaxID=3346859 RepID=UPI0036CD01F9
MTDREWAQVRAAMPVPGWLEGRGGQPENYCHRQMIDAIRFLVDNGIKWRAMPVDFPAWHRVYVFFRRWRDKGLVKEFHDRLRGKTRAAAGRGRSRPQASSTPSRSKPPRPCPPPHAASTVGRRSTAASGTSWSTRQGCC